MKEINPSNYVLLEGRDYGSSSSPDLLICKYRLSADERVKQGARLIGVNVKNGAKENNGRGYIIPTNWTETMGLLDWLGSSAPSPRQFWNFYELLKSKKAFDGNGIRIDEGEIENILDEMLGIRMPHRLEHLDAKFELKNGKMYIHSGHRIDHNNDGKLFAEKTEQLQLYLTEQVNAVMKFNQQGMPTQKSKSIEIVPGENIGYNPPKTNSVAAVGVVLGTTPFMACDGASFWHANIGVREVRKLQK